MDKTGETHQGLFDLAFLNTIPNFVVMAPKNFEELEKMLEYGINLKKPVSIRYPRGGEENINFEKSKSIEFGKAEILKEGNDITIIAIGKMVARAMQVADLLKEKNLNVEVINARFLKPLDKEAIIKSAKKTGKIVTIEDGIIDGGLGTTVIKTINVSDLKGIKIKTFGYNNFVVKHGTTQELEKKFGLDAENIAKDIEIYIKML